MSNLNKQDYGLDRKGTWKRGKWPIEGMTVETTLRVGLAQKLFAENIPFVNLNL